MESADGNPRHGQIRNGAYAADGGIYIITSLACLWSVEGVRPDRADILGAVLCLVGSGVILLGRSSSGVP